MDNERAKLILRAYRADGSDATDPIFAEALAQAERDPDLARWFAEERSLDARMTQAMAAIRPPGELKDTLLLTGKISCLPQQNGRTVVLAGIAAAVAVLAVAGALLFVGPQPVASEFTVAAVTEEIIRLQRGHRISLGAMTSDRDQVRMWLREHGGPDGFTEPTAAGMRLGCEVLEIAGNKVSLVCFQTAEGHILHFLVMDRRHLANPPQPGAPEIHPEGELAFATWADPAHAYLFVGKMAPEELRRYL